MEAYKIFTLFELKGKKKGKKGLFEQLKSRESGIVFATEFKIGLSNCVQSLEVEQPPLIAEPENWMIVNVWLILTAREEKSSEREIE